MRGLPADLGVNGLFALLLACHACSPSPNGVPITEAADAASYPNDAEASGTVDGTDGDARAEDDGAADAAPDGSADQADTVDVPDGSSSTDAEGSEPSEPDTTPPEPVGPWVEIGQGEFGFQPVDPDSTLSCIFGPQGSYHLWAAVRLHNVVPSTVRVEMQASISGAHVGTGFAAPLDSEWTLNPDGTADIFGQFLYLDFGIDFPARSGQSVTLTAAVGSPSFDTVFATATGRFSCLQ